ncbi:succinate-semialdehyde dehydrogenase/glutarate-semialdehyde dehydrogenase [Salinibacterium amurskyense]|uniref:Succinate-semialdehyde dehydrogenase/glutarate-semialdehyde dehydrogenase n=1 Tax=Salinibacterium amurskyense TaxID=205941 RepID=A0A2M9D3V5_9MICO|nr:succinic semialdehyde dehydrogenase [Salinibacterium amurskyense]PJJ78735.1 succinate-semialdehyde dehydrogenase/glutarate-semialdehyde dehydrogenase [Salinibacterium amurskyense]RLQ80809.1 aldehyde dehydrogenase family protein [Salinibacterium amurskyense]GHD83745.1 succinic semialdehyde dehydrogenase [Salinibacterium amurskyense]
MSPHTVASLIGSRRRDTLVAQLRCTTSDTATVIAPFSGQPLHELPQSSTRDVRDAAASARTAQRAWRNAGFAYRRRVLLRAHDLLLERQEELLDLLQTESGKTRGQAFEEIFQAASITRYYAVSAERVLATKRRRAGIPLLMSTRVSYSPKQLIGVVTPWNYPIALGAMDIVPALAAGSAVIQKIDNQGALSMLATREAYIDAGVPAAVWPILAGPGNQVGNAVVDAADYICFTGSTPTGTKVGKRAAGRLIGASLELGGKNPLLVLGDADPIQAAEDAVYACFASMGQLCVSIERIYVHKSIEAEFTRAFAERVKALSQTSALDYSGDVGSLTSQAQLERVQAHVEDAVTKGATVVAGGIPRPDLGPYFYAPTGLTGVTAEMECFANETFGPVVAITSVDSDTDAINRANDTEFGLNASIFSGSIAHARRLADRLDAGSVNINEGYRSSFSSVDAPMGGMKHSGLGRRNGPEGILRFVQSRTVSQSNGILQLPRSGAEFAAMAGLMVTLLTVLKVLRRR